MNSFGKILKVIRKSHGDSLRKLSEKTGIIFTHIGRIERGDLTVNKNILEKIITIYPKNKKQLISAYAEDNIPKFVLEELQSSDEDMEITISKLIKTKRKEIGYSYNKLSTITGIDKGELSRIERGERKTPNICVIKKILQALELDLIDSYLKLGYLDEEDIKKNDTKKILDGLDLLDLKIMLELYLKELIYKNYLINSKEILDKIRKIEGILHKIK